ncbi:MAG: cupin domain-containing protein [Bacteroidia bacterium]|nr:cupin domain-containing protein [Bacteroidia bacterium]
MTADELVKHLNLVPHPEGGFYRETYRSAGTIPAGATPEFEEARNFATAIYFLIEHTNFSALHKIKSDETWHFYTGDALEVIEINAQGQLKTTIIGNHTEYGECFQYTVPANVWFGSRVRAGGRFSLVGCTVAPGFDFRDFEMGSRLKLLEAFPQHAPIILEMTREENEMD